MSPNVLAVTVTAEAKVIRGTASDPKPNPNEKESDE